MRMPMVVATVLTVLMAVSRVRPRRHTPSPIDCSVTDTSDPLESKHPPVRDGNANDLKLDAAPGPERKTDDPRDF